MAVIGGFEKKARKSQIQLGPWEML